MSKILLPKNGRADTREETKGAGRQPIVAKPALVCDLDGTLRYNKNDPDGFINAPEDIAFYDGVIEALWRYREDGFLVAVVTNQGGVAHGHMTEGDFRQQQGRMDQLARQVDDRGMPTHMTLPAFCMENGTEEKYAFRSLLRKPRYGALAVLENQATMNNVRIKWDESVMIGDREEDRAMAEAAGITFWWAEAWREEVQAADLGGPSDE